MKHVFVLILLLIFSGSLIAQDENYKEIRKHCNRFASAVKKHDSKACLNYFDTDYRIKQHDQFLEGNTKQFLDEFFAGEYTNGNTTIDFYVPDFYSIVSVKCIGLDYIDENICLVVLEITMKDGGSLSSLVHVLYRSKGNMGFVGSMG